MMTSADYWEKIEKHFSIFEFRLGINFFPFSLEAFWESWGATRLARGWGWNWYRVKEGTFLHLLEQSRALSDQYFSSYEFLNLFLFPYANGILIKIRKTSITSDIVNQSARNLVWSLKMEGLTLCFVIIQIWACLLVGWSVCLSLSLSLSISLSLSLSISLSLSLYLSLSLFQSYSRSKIKSD